MKAVIHSKYGSPEFLRVKSIDKPIPKKTEVLIRVKACTVNRTDCAMLRAKPPIMRLFTGLRKPKKPILGTDFSGEILGLGEEVSKFKVGDKVFGFNDLGLCSHAEYICISENEALAIIPENRSYVQAAASIEGLHYAQNIINKVNLVDKQNALVIGGTGAIGSACIQLLKTHNINVDSVCDGTYAQEVINLGASLIYDYTSEDFTQSENKYDYIFDCVGKSSFSACKNLLENKGIYISSELGPGNENLYLPLITVMNGGKRVKFPFPSNRPYSVNLAKKLSEEGTFTPLIEKTYGLEQIVEAFNHTESGQKIGNVVLKIN